MYVYVLFVEDPDGNATVDVFARLDHAKMAAQRVVDWIAHNRDDQSVALEWEPDPQEEEHLYVTRAVDIALDEAFSDLTIWIKCSEVRTELPPSALPPVGLSG